MAHFIGCKPGDNLSATAGARQPTVRLTIAEDGLSLVLDGKSHSIGKTTVVIWHKGPSGSFHGFSDLTRLKAGEKTGACRSTAGVLACSRSSSGGDDIAAAVVEPDAAAPVALIRSGYDGRRGWSVTPILPGQEPQKISIEDFRQAHPV